MAKSTKSVSVPARGWSVAYSGDASISLTTCRHCHQVKRLRRRRLCRSCYQQLEIRDLYPRVFRSTPDDTNGYELPPATDVQPGAEKIRIFQERVRLHQSLWNPLDPVLDLRFLDAFPFFSEEPDD